MNPETFGKNGCVSLIAKKAILALWLCVALLWSVTPIFGQAYTARISGTVTDATGRAIAGATVSVTDVDISATRTVTTDESGAYSLPALRPGTKTVKADFKGFKTVERQNVKLEVGQELRLDFTLQPGEVTETVRVETAIPLVETTNAEQGGTLSNQTINDLPLNGRNYENLLTLRPGVTIYAGGGGWTQSSNGIRPDDNMYLVDGLTQNEPWTGMSIVNGNSLAGDVQTFIPLDAIQEFRTAQNVRADSGFKPGSVVNVGLKAGTNEIHGTAYAFGRTDAWDAKNYFDTAAQGFPPFPLSLKQFGATGGGAIKKDRLFYFLAYEGQQYQTAGSFTATSPVTCGVGDPGCGLDPATVAAANGCTNLPMGAVGNCNLSLVDACKDLIAGGNTIAPLSATIAGLNPATCAVNANKPGATIVPGSGVGQFPINMATTVPGTPTVFPNLTNTSRADNGLAKIDYHINEKNVVNGYYFIGQNSGTWNDGFAQLNPNSQSLLYVRAQLGSAGWVWTPSSRWVNEFRAGYGRYYQTYDAADHKIPASQYGINTGVTNPLYGGFPTFFFPIGPFNGQLGGSWPKYVGPDWVYDFVDHVSYLRGKHNFKFGGEITKNVHTGLITARAKGRLKFKPVSGPFFNNLENFLAGDVGTGSEILTGNAYRESSFWGYAGFVQDDWRATNRLTVNLGVRYELNTVLKEKNNFIGNFDPTAGMVQVGKQIGDLYNGDHNNFAPRVGFAWDISGNGKTVLRAGAGIAYEQIAQESFMALGNLLGAASVPTAATIVVNGVATPGTGTINLQALVFNGKAGRQALSANYQSNGAVPIFPTSATPVCGDGSSNPNVLAGLPTTPCTIFAVDRNLRTPYVSNWNLGIERQLTNNMSLEVSYVGNHGTKLIGFRDINEINPQSAAEIACVHCESNFPFPQFPYLSYIDQLSGLYHSNYNGLQVTLVQRVSHGLNFTVGYTYSHALDNASSNWSGAGTNTNGFAPNSYYGNSDFDLRHRFTATITYAIPGRGGFAQMLKGWQINSIVTLQSGAEWGMLDAGDDFSGTNQTGNPATLGEHWDFFGNVHDFKSNQNSIPYCLPDPSDPNPTFANPGSIVCTQTTPGGQLTFGKGSAQAMAFATACFNAANALGSDTVASLNGVPTPAQAAAGTGPGGPGGCYAQGKSVMIPPAFGTFGTAGRNIFPSYPFKNWDFSVYKDWKFKERLTFQFRAEIFNLLNHPQFANPGGGPNGYVHNDPSVPNQFACGCATPDVAGENPVLGSGSNRAMQLGLKIIF